jgi:iron complex transport system substrate-binding protein
VIMVSLEKRKGAARFALVLAAALFVTGCSTAGGSTAVSPSVSARDGAASDASALALPDPHSLTGLSEVADISDPEPIAGSFTQNLPAHVTDAEGNAVTITDTSRILALDINGTLSRTVIALGYGKNIVGRTVSSTEQQLASLPVVTENGHSLNTEAILALSPTLIVADRSIGPREALDQIRSSGVPVVLVDSERSLDTTDALIESVANALGVPEAGKALAERTDAETQSALAQIARWTPKEPLDIAFLYVRGTAGVFFILGSDEGADDLIEAVGGNDVAAEHGITATTPANAEALVSLDPEVIFVMKDGLASTDGVSGLLARPGVAQTRAGQSGRIISIPDGISLSFGPQTGEVLLAIARALYEVP